MVMTTFVVVVTSEVGDEITVVGIAGVLGWSFLLPVAPMELTSSPDVTNMTVSALCRRTHRTVEMSRTRILNRIRAILRCKASTRCQFHIENPASLDPLLSAIARSCSAAW